MRGIPRCTPPTKLLTCHIIVRLHLTNYIRFILVLEQRVRIREVSLPDRRWNDDFFLLFSSHLPSHPSCSTRTTTTTLRNGNAIDRERKRRSRETILARAWCNMMSPKRISGVTSTYLFYYFGGSAFFPLFACFCALLFQQEGEGNGQSARLPDPRLTAATWAEAGGNGGVPMCLSTRQWSSGRWLFVYFLCCLFSKVGFFAR